MRTLAKIALGIAIFIGPPVLHAWGLIGGDATISLYILGLVLGFALGAWHQRYRREGDWREFARTHSFKRRKNADALLG